MTSRLTRYSVAFLVLMLLLVPLFQTRASAQDAAQDEEPTTHTAEYTLEWDSAELAKDAGITQEEAKEAILRAPRVGELQMALLRRGPQSYGGMYVEYHPEYAIKTLAEPHRGAEVRRAVDELGFGDLGRFVSIKETAFTEQALARAQAAVSRSRARFTWTDTDLVRGKVILAVDNEGDVGHARDEMRRTDLGAIPADRVDVVVSGPARMDHSYGGLSLTPECTTGFTVFHAGLNVEGVSTAGHCQNNGMALSHHSDVGLQYENEKFGDSQDIQWHRTPNIDDRKEYQAWPDGTVHTVESRTHRDAMVIGNAVCHYGKTTERGCGTIAGKTLDPDTYRSSCCQFNATFIRVHDDATLPGDSGGPWFLNNSAYGTHSGSTGACEHGGLLCNDPYFMAQNYMDAIGIQVRVTGE